MHRDFFLRFVRRLSRYSLISTSTFLLDLAIAFTLITFFNVSYPIAFATGFLIGVTLNFSGNYYWAYRGTTRSRRSGFLLFVGAAIIGALVISLVVSLLVETFGTDLLIARLAIAILVGLANFLFNTFFNFRLL